MPGMLMSSSTIAGSCVAMASSVSSPLAVPATILNRLPRSTASTPARMKA